MFFETVADYWMVGDDMYFDYEPYKAYCYKNPVMGMAAFSFAFVICIVTIVVQALRKKLVLKDAIIYGLFALGYGVVVCTVVGQLLQGGMYLRYEKEVDAVQMQGRISDIRGLGIFSFPRVKGDYEYEEERGYEYTIDGVKCMAVRKGSLKVGDYVTVRYLPKSGYILYIAETEGESSDLNGR